MMIIQQKARMALYALSLPANMSTKSWYAGQVSIRIGFGKLCMMRGDESLGLQVAKTSGACSKHRKQGLGL